MSERTNVARAALSLAALALVAAGCGQQVQPGDSIARANHPLQSAAPKPAPTPTRTVAGDARPGDPTTTPAPSTTQQAPMTSTQQPQGRQPAPRQQPKPQPKQTGLCTAGDLKLSLGNGDAGAGTMWRPLRFTNKSSSSCVIQGYPGVSYVAGNDGHQVGAAAYREGHKGARITLRPGKTANAPVGFAQVHNWDSSECKPTPVKGLRVYPPQETHSIYIDNPTTGCANENLKNGYQLTVQTMQPGSGS